MKKILLGLALVATLVSGLVSVSPAFAAACTSGQVSTPSAPCDTAFSVSLPATIAPKTVSSDSLQNTLIGFANILIGLVAIISVFFIIWGAIQWMNEGAEKGQKTVVNAVIGLVIAVLAFFIVQLATGTATFLQGQVK
jgi:Type IV secretion system pilin